MPVHRKPQEPAILIWAPAGQTPTLPAFEASGATTFESLSDAIIHAHKEAAARPDRPWILQSDAVFGPDQIRVLHATVAAERVPDPE